MSGRRLRATVMRELGDWAEHIVLEGYSNRCAGYITTSEEYLLQHYEAGHTLHVRWTLPAYQKIASQLAVALESGTTARSTVTYDDWRGKSPETALSDEASDRLPEGVNYGDALAQPRREYRTGGIVAAEFWSTNPSKNYTTGNNHLLVESKIATGWTIIATDSDWNTRIR